MNRSSTGRELYRMWSKAAQNNRRVGRNRSAPGGRWIAYTGIDIRRGRRHFCAFSRWNKSMGPTAKKSSNKNTQEEESERASGVSVSGSGRKEGRAEKRRMACALSWKRVPKGRTLTGVITKSRRSFSFSDCVLRYFGSRPSSPLSFIPPPRRLTFITSVHTH